MGFPGHLARRVATAIGVLLAAVLPLRAASPTPDSLCHHEGKDPYCGHYQATVAALLAEEGGHVEEADADTDIVHCFLDIEVDPTTEAIAGSNTLTIDSRVPGLSTFTLDLRDNLMVDGVTVGGSAAVYLHANHEIVITLDRAYGPGERFEVRVDYHGSPEKQGIGSFKWSTHNSHKMVSTLSSPWYAHTWWPCKDELIDKFTLDLWVTVPDWMKVAANGTMVRVDALPDNHARYQWQTSYPIATYLVAFAATNYYQWTDYYNHAGGSMPVTFFAYPEDYSRMHNGVSDVLQQITTFSRPDVFGEYPFINEKYGIAQYPFLGGMEHQTMTAQGVFFNYVNAHELSHQWWGDAITCATWHDIWLNEGFATFAEALYFEKKPGGSKGDYHAWLNSRRPFFFDGSVYVYDASTLAAIYSTSNVYYKGAWVLHMLRHVVGDEAFFDILAEYRAAYEGGSATTADFRAIAESVHGANLSWFFGRWVYGVGAPSYYWGWREHVEGNQHKALLSIEQYQTEYNNFLMPIDVVVTTALGTTTHVVWQSADIEWFSLPVDGPVTNVSFDPDRWILTDHRLPVIYRGPIHITDTSPPAGPPDEPAMNVGEIGIDFSDEINYVDADFTLTGSATGAVPVAVGYLPGDQRITLTPAAPLSVGETWTVLVRDSVTGQTHGELLDGDTLIDPINPAGLPSGDGVPGGDAVFSFSVAHTGDSDLDRDVDLEDFGLLQACVTGPDVPITVQRCQPTDLDRDDDIDQDDVAIFHPCLAGSRVSPGPGCG